MRIASRRDPRHSFFRLMLVMVAAMLLPEIAHAAGLLAQAQSMLSQYIPATDESMAMLQQVFGTFVLNPFSQSANTSGLLGAIFLKFNMFIFTVAMIWFAYTGFSALMHTMHEGVLFGSRMSTVWLPLRVGFGAISLMPVFGGWALCQALMMLAATLGIAGANAITQVAIDSASGFTTVVNPSVSSKASLQMQSVEADMLVYQSCTQSVNRQNQEANDYRQAGLPVNLYATVGKVGTSLVEVSFPNNLGPSGCGKIQMSFSPRSSTSLMGFRIQGINYDGIRDAAMRAHITALTTMVGRAQKIVAGAAAVTKPSAAYDAAVADIRANYLGSYSPLVQAAIASNITEGNQSAISDQLKQNMRAGGWITLGSWYQTFAEENEAMNEMLDPVMKSVQGAQIESSAMLDVVGGVEAIAKQAMADQGTQGGVTTATGNFSIGQFLMRGVMDTTVGASGTGASNTVNPIIAFKNLGDNTLVLAETIYVVVKAGNAVVDAIPGGKAVSGAIKGSSVIGKVTSFFSSGIAGALMSIVSDIGALLAPLGIALLASAAVMAFYIPMVPFIQWFAAIINWFASIFESLVGGSLWAFAHFDADGEGMGQRTSYGYLYLLNNFARPIILAIAFFVASAGVVILGTYLFKYFGHAVANAQGNSTTGLVSIVAYLVIFAVLGMTLVNSIFNSTLHMADRVIQFIGAGSSAGVGHDTESRVSQVFVAAARTGTGMIRPGGGLARAAANAAGGGSKGLGSTASGARGAAA